MNRYFPAFWLLPPLLAALASASIRAVRHEDDLASASLVALYFVFLLPLTLGVPLLVRWLTRGRGGRGGFAGFCVGWAGSLLVWNGDSWFFPGGISFWVIVGLCLSLPVLGYGVGTALSPKR